LTYNRYCVGPRRINIGRHMVSTTTLSRCDFVWAETPEIGEKIGLTLVPLNRLNEDYIPPVSLY
jgi:hypothetical protein